MILYGTWDVSLDGETYRWEPDEVTPGEELMILGECGFASYDEWLDKIDDREAVACQTLIWFLRRKAGRQEDRIAVQVAHRKIRTEQIAKPDGSPEASAASGSPTPEAATSSTSSTGSESGPGNGAS